MTTKGTPDTGTTPASDRLGVAARLTVAVLLLSAAATVFFLTAPNSYSERQIERAASLFHVLRLSHLSLSPTGRPFRAPEFMRAGVDLRFSPWVSFPEPYPESLVTTRPAPNKNKGASL